MKRVSAILASQVHYGTHQYAYIANVSVSKFARRQGIASNMLQFATDVANLAGMRKLFVHVNVENEAAQELYKKTGFKVVEAASSSRGYSYSGINFRLQMTNMVH
ncbi:N-alpha-acetyltransferase 30-like [Impatiens glandulifera]|uniref:N-alpha-acetyltransferase 30-like n=1 Tax=Impatiens glandulifera TaxID=253017 RepID=UPI001FB0B0F5|nr:N-alpha-acetyltransferase 30-like [Impatiens glandulifera]